MSLALWDSVRVRPGTNITRSQFVSRTVLEGVSTEGQAWRWRPSLAWVGFYGTLSSRCTPRVNKIQIPRMTLGLKLIQKLRRGRVPYVNLGTELRHLWKWPINTHTL